MSASINRPSSRLPPVALIAALLAAGVAGCGDVSWEFGRLWARNESDQQVLIRLNFPENPDYKFRTLVVLPHSEGLVAPSPARNGSPDVLEAGTCRVLGSWRSSDRYLGIVISADLAINWIGGEENVPDRTLEPYEESELCPPPASP